jgi:DNA polymerase delta subunit 2
MSAAAAHPLILSSPVFSGVRSPPSAGSAKAMQVDEVAAMDCEDQMRPLTDAELTGQPTPIARTKAHWDPATSSRFVQEEVVDRRENYGSVYNVRLRTLSERLKSAAAEKWAGGVIEGLPLVDQISSIQKGVDVVVLGTVYKEMRLKPDILAEFAAERVISVRKTVSTYVSEDPEGEVVLLEDESGRLPIVAQDGCEGLEMLCTGTSVVLRGELIKGSLRVNGFCTSGLAPQPPLPQLDTDKFILIASDLQLGREGLSPLPSQLLADYVCGHLGSGAEQEFCASIVRVVLAGNTTPTPPSEALGSHEAASRATQQLHTGSVRLLDQFATQLCAAVDVDLMPGESDPVNTLFPQQAFHPSLVPAASELSSFHRVTNPYECSVDGVVMLGTDGVNVADQHKYNDPASGRVPIDTMVDMLQTSHMSPTAPDTIQSYPFPDRDPFVLVREPPRPRPPAR